MNSNCNKPVTLPLCLKGSECKRRTASEEFNLKIFQMESVTKVKSLNRPRKIIRTQVRIILSSSAYLLPVQLAERKALPKRAVLVKFRGQFRAGGRSSKRRQTNAFSFLCETPANSISPNKLPNLSSCAYLLQFLHSSGPFPSETPEEIRQTNNNG